MVLDLCPLDHGRTLRLAEHVRFVSVLKSSATD